MEIGKLIISSSDGVVVVMIVVRNSLTKDAGIGKKKIHFLSI